MKKVSFLPIGLLLVMSTSFMSGCSNNDPYSGSTQFTVWNYVGTMDNIKGVNWIKQAAQRFETAHENDSYESGKTGVHINFEGARTLDYDHKTFMYGADIYLDEYRAKINELSSNDLLLDISDIAGELNNKHAFDSSVVNRLKGPDGKYYALPQYEWFSGVSYDRGTFESDGFLFADSEESDVDTYNCLYGTANFIGSSDAELSVGPDGVKGTNDDGLPSSLQELCILCDKIKVDYNPIIIGGRNYEFYLVMGLWSALAGYDVMNNSYCNFGAPVKVVKYDNNGNIIFKTDVDAFGNPLQNSKNQIKQPETEEVVLNDTNGYLLDETVERYYALAFLELCYKNNWFNENYTTGDPSTGTIQTAFVNGGKGGKNMILLDGSYWYHEANSKGIFTNYAQEHPENPVKDIRYMSLPTRASGSVTEGNGKKQALLDLGSSLLFVTKRAADTDGKLAAVKDFIKFLYSDEELATFTESTGMTVPMDYDFDKTKVDSYNLNLIDLKKESQVVRYSSDHVAFRKYQDKFGLSWSSPLIGLTIKGVDYLNSGYYAMFADKISSEQIFTSGRMSKSIWEGYLK